MSLSKIFVAGLSITSMVPSALSAAVPHEDDIERRQCTGSPPPDPPPGFCPKIDTEEPFTSDAFTTGNSGKSGATLSVQKSYTVGSSWSVGGELGLAFEKLLEMSGSLSASVSVSFEESTSIGVEYECPLGGEFFCSLNVRHGMMRVKGKIEQIGPTETCSWGIRGSGGDFEAALPRKDETGNSVFQAVLCTCCAMADAENEAAPDECCVSSCAGGKVTMVRSGEKIVL